MCISADHLWWYNVQRPHLQCESEGVTDTAIHDINQVLTEADSDVTWGLLANELCREKRSVS